MMEAVVIAFDCLPSDIEQVYWKYTENDINLRLRLYLAERQATFVQDFQNIAIIAGKMFGSSTKGSAKNPDTVVPQTEAEAIAAFKSVFGK